MDRNIGAENRPRADCQFTDPPRWSKFDWSNVGGGWQGTGGGRRETEAPRCKTKRTASSIHRQQLNQGCKLPTAAGAPSPDAMLGSQALVEDPCSAHVGPRRHRRKEHGGSSGRDSGCMRGVERFTAGCQEHDGGCRSETCIDATLESGIWWRARRRQCLDEAEGGLHREKDAEEQEQAQAAKAQVQDQEEGRAGDDGPAWLERRCSSHSIAASACSHPAQVNACCSMPLHGTTTAPSEALLPLSEGHTKESHVV